MIVKKGDKGNNVGYIQELLVRVGHLRVDQVDDIAGDITVQAIRNYQQAMGLTVDGIAGFKTIDMLESGFLAKFPAADQASEHFSFTEMTRSATAQARGISNTPNAQEKQNIIYSALQMEKIRMWLTKKAGCDIPIYITSCFRCERVNNLVGGSKTSAHRFGLAVDFSAEKFGSITKICEEIIAMQEAGQIEFDQLILEFPPSGWVHIGFRAGGKNQRRQVLTAKKQNNKTVYLSGLQP